MAGPQAPSTASAAQPKAAVLRPAAAPQTGAHLRQPGQPSTASSPISQSAAQTEVPPAAESASPAALSAPEPAPGNAVSSRQAMPGAWQTVAGRPDGSGDLCQPLELAPESLGTLQAGLIHLGRLAGTGSPAQLPHVPSAPLEKLAIGRSGNAAEPVAKMGRAASDSFGLLEPCSAECSAQLLHQRFKWQLAAGSSGEGRFGSSTACLEPAPHQLPTIVPLLATGGTIPQGSNMEVGAAAGAPAATSTHLQPWLPTRSTAAPPAPHPTASPLRA